MGRVMIEVDDRGRASLARLRFRNTQLVAEELEDGVFTIQPAVILTKLEALTMKILKRWLRWQGPERVKRKAESAKDSFAPRQLLRLLALHVRYLGSSDLSARVVESD